MMKNRKVHLLKSIASILVRKLSTLRLLCHHISFCNMCQNKFLVWRLWVFFFFLHVYLLGITLPAFSRFPLFIFYFFFFNLKYPHKTYSLGSSKSHSVYMYYRITLLFLRFRLPIPYLHNNNMFERVHETF